MRSTNASIAHATYLFSDHSRVHRRKLLTQLVVETEAEVTDPLMRGRIRTQD